MGRRAHRRSAQIGQQRTAANGNQGRNQNVYRGLFADQLAQFRRRNGNEQNGQRPAVAAQGIGGRPHGGEGEEHQGRGL